MSTIVLDGDLRMKLNDCNEPVEIRDQTGKIVGHFLPTVEYQRMLRKTIEVPFSKEELDKRRAEAGGSSLAEFWRKMGVQ